MSAPFLMVELMHKAILFLVALISSVNGFAQSPGKQQNSQMQFIGMFNAGHPGVNIYKMYDVTEDVLCYMMMPEVVNKRQLENGAMVYEANSVGAMSCLKVKALPIVAPLPSKK